MIRTTTAGSRTAYMIAVLPIENLSGGKAPLKELRKTIERQVQSAGFAVLDEGKLNLFMARHRLRYIGGIDEESAKLFAQEEGVSGVLVSSLEFYGDGYPPKLILTSRLVTTGNEPHIDWMESVALVGNDSPGLFETGIIRNVAKLSEKGVEQLVASLASAWEHNFEVERAMMPKSTMPPRQLFRQGLSPDRRFRVVVLPFYNRTGRKYAGEIMTLHFVKELQRLGNFQVVEPGIVRNKLLQYRLIMEGGMSNANADVIFDVLQANLVLTGKVVEYQEARGESGIPVVEFSASMFDKESHRTVLSADSYHTGDERVHFFDIGRIGTACGVAGEMIRGIVAPLRQQARQVR
jgi:TolB-like protein